MPSDPLNAPGRTGPPSSWPLRLDGAVPRVVLVWALFLPLLVAAVVVSASRQQEQTEALVLAQMQVDADDAALALDSMLQIRRQQIALIAGGSGIEAAIRSGDGAPAAAEFDRVFAAVGQLQMLCLYEGGAQVAARTRAGGDLCPERLPEDLSPFAPGGELQTLVAVPAAPSARLLVRYDPSYSLSLLRSRSSALTTHTKELLTADGTLFDVGGGGLVLGSDVGNPEHRDGLFFRAGGDRAVGATRRVGDTPVFVRVSTDEAEFERIGTIGASEIILYLAALVLGMSLLVGWVTRSIVLPLRAVMDASDRLAAGQFDVQVPLRGPGELRRLAASLNDMARQLQQLYGNLEEQVRSRSEALQGALDRERRLRGLTQEQTEELRSQNEELQAQALELREYQADLARQKEALVAQNRELERTNLIKSVFVASMSHELRTPLNAVIGFSELLLEGVVGDLGDEQREFVGDIHRSGKHLLVLINEILDLSKIEAGQMDVALEAIDLRLPVAEAEEMLRPLAAQKQIRLHVDAPEEVVGRIDGQRMRQVVINLVSNAIKFTPEGGNVEVSVRADGADAVVAIRDDGIGIDPAHHELIFEAFQQVDGTMTRSHGGTGLGLSLVRRFLGLMNGTVHVESRLGEGAVFVTRVPLANPPAAAAIAAGAAQEAPIGILVAEDDPPSRELVVRMLRHRGHEVVAVGDGASALAHLRTALPHVAVLDLMMPGIDGFALLRALRELPGGDAVGVAVLTAKELLREEERQLLALGAHVVRKGAMGSAEFLATIEALAAARREVA